MALHSYCTAQSLFWQFPVYSRLKEQCTLPGEVGHTYTINVSILEIPLWIQNLPFNSRSWGLLYENSKRNIYSSSRILQISDRIQNHYYLHFLEAEIFTGVAKLKPA